MANDRQCMVHFPASATSLPENLCVLSKHQLNAILQRAKQWLELNKNPENSIAQHIVANQPKIEKFINNNNIINNNNNDDDGNDDDDDCYYYAHNRCYLMFASQSKLEKAK